MVMILNNMDNLTSFGYSILTGILTGIIYDMFKAFRYSKKPREKDRFKYIEDLLFWLIATIIFFTTAIKTSDGVLRGFLFIGFFVGGALYFLIGSKYVFGAFLRFFKLIIQSINEIIRIIKMPFEKLMIKKRVKRILSIRKQMKAERKKHWKIIRGKK